MTQERLAELARRLDELAALPVAGHPDVLEDLHRSLTSELDALASVGAAPPRGP